MKKYKIFFLFIGLFIYNFVVNYFTISNNDLIWNYGFCYNVAKGLKMYTDFNMVITPFYPTLFGLLMKLLGNNSIIFFLSNALLPTIIFTIIYKYYRKAFVESILLVSFISTPNYNLLCLTFLYILFVLEDKKKNDYLIGIVLGLTFLTKSPMGLLTLASLYYYKDIKKIFKRFIGFLIPNIIYIIYFYINGSLFDYINYAFGSLLDFATDNYRSTFGILIIFIAISYLIYKFIKKKDIKLLYILFFQIMAYPIFNEIHIILCVIPILIYVVMDVENEMYLKYRKYLCILLICPVLSSIMQYTLLDMRVGTNALKYKRVEASYVENANIIKDNVDNLDSTYFIMYEAYYNKLLLGLDINKYDVMLEGNLGYNGVKNTIKYFDSLSMGTQFLIYHEHEGGQSPEDIYNHIKENYKLKKSFDKYELYVK